MNIHNHHFSYLIIGMLALGGCTSFDELDPEDLEADAIDEDDAINEDDAIAELGAVDELQAPGGQQPHLTFSLPGIDSECADRRAPIIGLLEDPVDHDCDLDLLPGHPLWTDWSATYLFEDGSDWVQGLSAAPSSRLMSYCKYEYTGTEANRDIGYLNLHTALSNYAGIDIDEISTDCLGTIPMAGLNDLSVASAFNDVFRAGVGAVDHNDLASIDHETVRVGLIDTASQDEDPAHAHATHMRALLEDLTCQPGDGDCKELIHNSLATPRVGLDTVDWINGSGRGYATDLALAMYYEVQHWLETMEETGDFQRLVIAAPVGYDAGGVYTNDPNRATMMAVQDVLTMASCLGVVVVAPAGNVRPGTCDDNQGGLVAPAMYEAHEAPDQATCAALGYVPDWDLGDYPIYSNGDTARLAYATGGLDHSDIPVVNQRPNSMPRMAALSQSATGAPTNINASAMSTGTSVSAVAVAAAVALRWRMDPSLTPFEVMDEVYASSWTTTMDADTGAFSNEPVARLSIAKVLDDAGLVVNAALTPPDPVTATDPIASAWDSRIAIDGTDLVNQKAWDPGALVCELADFSEVVRPEPDRPNCDWCGTSTGYGAAGEEALLMTITNEAWAVNLTVDKAYLHIVESTGTRQTVTLNSTAIADINTADPTKTIEVLFTAPNMVQAELEFEYIDITGSSVTYSNSLVVN